MQNFGAVCERKEAKETKKKGSKAISPIKSNLEK